jgi:hypothetical protein
MSLAMLLNYNKITSRSMRDVAPIAVTAPIAIVGILDALLLNGNNVSISY